MTLSSCGSQAVISLLIGCWHLVDHMLTESRGSQAVGISWLAGCLHLVDRRLSASRLLASHGSYAIGISWLAGCRHIVSCRLLASCGLQAVGTRSKDNNNVGRWKAAMALAYYDRGRSGGLHQMKDVGMACRLSAWLVEYQRGSYDVGMACRMSAWLVGCWHGS